MVTMPSNTPILENAKGTGSTELHQISAVRQLFVRHVLHCVQSAHEWMQPLPRESAMEDSGHLVIIQRWHIPLLLAKASIHGDTLADLGM